MTPETFRTNSLKDKSDSKCRTKFKIPLCTRPGGETNDDLLFGCANSSESRKVGVRMEEEEDDDGDAPLLPPLITPARTRRYRDTASYVVGATVGPSIHNSIIRRRNNSEV